MHAPAYNLANVMRRGPCPGRFAHGSLTSLQEKLVKIGAKVVRHAPLGRLLDGRGVAVPRTVRAFPETDRRAATTTGFGIGLNGAAASSPQEERVCIRGKSQMVIRRRFGWWTRREARRKLGRPSTASSEPARMLAFGTFHGFIRRMSVKSLETQRSVSGRVCERVGYDSIATIPQLNEAPRCSQTISFSILP